MVEYDRAGESTGILGTGQACKPFKALQNTDYPYSYAYAKITGKF